MVGPDSKPTKQSHSPPKVSRVRTCKKKSIVDFHVNETTKVDAGYPADYSFQEIMELEATGPEFANTSRLGKVERDANNMFLTKSLCVNNNQIKSIKNIDAMVNSIMAFPSRLSFLDLSFNEISDIDDALFKFPNIAVLYLHGNNISDMHDILKLKKLPNLHNLTLYGNPIYNDHSWGNHRVIVCNFIPHLKKLDYNGFSKIEKELPMSPKAVKFLEANPDKNDSSTDNKISDQKPQVKTFQGVYPPMNPCPCPPQCDYYG